MHRELSAAQAGALVTIEAALAERLAAMGEEDSGLFDYYGYKLAHGELLEPCDISAIAAVRERGGQFRRVWDIGTGIGQIAIMLAADGSQIVAVDHDRRRFAALGAMLDAIGQHDADLRRRIMSRFGSFPEIAADEDVAEDLAVVLNCAFTAPDTKYAAFSAGLRRFKAALVDVTRLFSRADTPEASSERAAALCRGQPVDAAPAFSYAVARTGLRGEVFLFSRR